MRFKVKSLKLNLKGKLFAASAGIGILAIIIALAAIIGLNSVASSSDRIHDMAAIRYQTAQLKYLQMQQWRYYQNFVFTQDQSLVTKAHELNSQFDAVLADLRNKVPLAKQRALDDFITIHNEWVDLSDNVAATYSNASGGSDIVKLVTDWDELGLKLDQQIPNLEVYSQQDMDATNASGLSARDLTFKILIGIVVIALIAAAAIAIVLSRDISNRTSRLSRALKKIAVGNLTEKIESDASDELGEMTKSYNEMQSYLSDLSSATDRIAKGDLSVRIEPKSNEDVLSKSFVQMASNIKSTIDDVKLKIEYLNQIPSMIAVVSPDYKILFLNKIGEQVLGKKQEEYIGQSCTALFCSKNDACDGKTCAGAKAFKKNEVVVEDSNAINSDGTAPVRCTAAPIHDNEGKTIGCVEYIQSISVEKNSIARMTDVATRLSKASIELSSASEQSGSATNQIASVSQQIAKGSEEQTRGIGEVKGALDSLSKDIDLVYTGSQEQAGIIQQASEVVKKVAGAANNTASGAIEAASFATQAAQVAKQGSVMLGKTIEGVKRINSSIQDSTKAISELGKYSEEIGNMISVIDDIASQTNLLALNAAIEAARAGDQGRGFAVVADEVKKLAERTSKETKEIAIVVGNVRKGVSQSVKVSNDGAKLAEEGSSMANEAGESLNRIMDVVNRMASQIEQISKAAKDMTGAADEMVKITDGLNTITGQNLNAVRRMSVSKNTVGDSTNTVAATIEENSAATEQMSASAEEMSAQVQQVVMATQSLAKLARELEKSVGHLDFTENSSDSESDLAAVASQEKSQIPVV